MGFMEKINVPVVEGFRGYPQRHEDLPPPKPPLPRIRIKSTDALLDKIGTETEKMKAAVDTIPQIINGGFDNMKNMKKLVTDNIKSFDDSYADLQKSKGSADYTDNMTKFLKAKSDFRNEVLANFKKTEDNIKNAKTEIEKLNGSFRVVGTFAESFVRFCDNINDYADMKQEGEPVFVDHRNFRNPAVPVEGAETKGLYDKAKDSATIISGMRSKVPGILQQMANLENEYRSGTVEITQILKDNYRM